MVLRMFTVGPPNTNCYVVKCEETRETAIIDPGFSSDEAEIILKRVLRLSLNVKYIVNSHGHADHICGNGAVKEKTGASILIHKEDAAILNDPDENCLDS